MGIIGSVKVTINATILVIITMKGEINEQDSESLVCSIIKGVNKITVLHDYHARITIANILDLAEMQIAGMIIMLEKMKIGITLILDIIQATVDKMLVIILMVGKMVGKNGFDLGNVGAVKAVNTDLLEDLLDMGITPVVSPIGTGMDDEKDVAYNCNADVAAGRIAGEIQAERVLFLTDIAGVLDKEMTLLKELSVKDVEKLIEDETITGGMIPKVTYATDAIHLGVKGAFITDGRVPHALLNEILGGGDTGKGSGNGGTIITL